ncbi:MAG: enolase C-terminal domain-like protein [Bacteroidia bacterium]
MSALNVSYISYPLTLKHTFNLTHGKRNTTPCVLLKLECDGYVSYGEASLPPYLKETPDSVISYFENINWNRFNKNNPLDFIDYLNSQEKINYPALAAIDMAIHDLFGKISGLAVHEILNIPNKISPLLSYTISYEEDENILMEKIKEAEPFKQIKLKLGTAHDKSFVEFVLKHTNKKFFVDVNEGWKTLFEAVDMCEFLKEHDCLFVEQPFKKNSYELTLQLKSKNILPVFADETICNLSDLENYHNYFDGINIKLLKCGGIKNALKMIAFARKMNLKIMMGCMTETSCGIAAASQISTLCDFADLDGAHLISNNPFKEISIIEGKIILQKKSGIGVEKTQSPIPEDF